MNLTLSRIGVSIGIAVLLSLIDLNHLTLSASAASQQQPNVIFGNASNVGSRDTSPSIGALQNWSATDKQFLMTELDFLNGKFPGLLARCDQLFFFRVKEIKSEAEFHKQDVQPITVSATIPGTIFFSDHFYHLEDRERRFFFIHEVVHAADIGNLVAYSPEFTALASDYSKTVLPKQTVRDPLPEELADSFALFVRGGLNKSLIERYKIKIAPLLTDGNQNRKLFNTLCGDGISAQTAKNFKEAIANFTKATTLFPESPLPHSLLSYAKLKEKDMDGALKECDTAQACFVSAGVPAGEPRRLTHAYMRALLLVQCKQDLAGAIVMLNEVIAYDPSNEQAVKLRVMCRETLSKREKRKSTK